MRKLILVATLLACGVPVVAQTAHHHPAVPSPGKVRQMGDRVAGTADALMDMDIGPILDSADPGRPHGHRTLGELTSRGDPASRARMHDEISRTSARIAATERELAIMAPMLLQTLAEARQRLKAAWREPAGAAPLPQAGAAPAAPPEWVPDDGGEASLAPDYAYPREEPQEGNR